MFAINHAATALVFKKKFPEVRMLWLLLSVQLIEFIWVGLNFIGIEKTATEKVVSYVGDIHLYHMPFSHSILSSVLMSIAAFVLVRLLSKEFKFALVITLAVASHIILDLLVHARDIPLSFISMDPKFGSQLYNLFPYLAFIIEFAYGIFCWYYYKGSIKLLFVIAGFNLANFTIFSPNIIGLESLFANRPIILAAVILIQIILTLVLVGKYATSSQLFMNNRKSKSQPVTDVMYKNLLQQ